MAPPLCWLIYVNWTPAGVIRVGEPYDTQQEQYNLQVMGSACS